MTFYDLTRKVTIELNAKTDKPFVNKSVLFLFCSKEITTLNKNNIPFWILKNGLCKHLRSTRTNHNKYSF